MSEEQLKAFLEKVKSDTSLQEKMKADADAVVAIAKAAGFSISADDINQTQSELSEEDLEEIIGGDFGSDALDFLRNAFNDFNRTRLENDKISTGNY